MFSKTKYTATSSLFCKHKHNHAGPNLTPHSLKGCLAPGTEKIIYLSIQLICHIFTRFVFIPIPLMINFLCLSIWISHSDHSKSSTLLRRSLTIFFSPTTFNTLTYENGQIICPDTRHFLWKTLMVPILTCLCPCVVLILTSSFSN